MSSRNFLVTGLAFLGGLFLFIFFLILLGTFLLFKGRPSLPSGEKVGVVEIKGLISEADQILKNLRVFRKDRNVKAVVVRIDSPGGAVGASQEIYRELKRLASEKPVVASMGSVAASGGLYVALGAPKILASPGTLTGSIGVMIQIPNVSKLLEKVGIEATVIKSGPYKDTGSLFRPLTEEEKALLYETIKDVYEQFVTAISEARKIPREKILEFADGRVFTGKQAKAWGLIDDFGNLEDAILLAAEMAKIKGTPQVVYPAEEKLWLRWLMKEDFGSRLAALFAPFYLLQWP
ncbi:MAG: signal peptide peptidase SppA [Thermodesulfobacteria bacterium]|nr:signal peptide peptidase SppA [Thermodesulfobacteriota bacterium]